MIRDFWVKNYLSIRDKQELSFEAKGPESELVSVAADGTFLYKLGILYGSNASGKSNMLIALNEVFRLLVHPKSDAARQRCMCLFMQMMSVMITMCNSMLNVFYERN